MMEALKQAIHDARRRAVMAVARGILSAIDDSKMAQEVQIQLLDGETADQIERFQEYGFTSAPFAQAEAVMVCVGGLRSHGIVIAVEDRRYRLKGLTAGEVALYDDQGQAVHLKRGGIVLSSPGVEASENLSVGNGASGTFTSPTGLTITVQDGIITNIV
jgi:phage baseplate assembly protein V